MPSIAELAHQRDPEAIAKIICQELEPLGIEGLGVEVDIVDSNLELQIRANSAIDKQKLLTLVRSGLQDLHIESVAKFKIHCWRNDEEMHEQRLLWTEQFMLDLPKSLSLSSSPDSEPESARSPEPQLSKDSVLQQAIARIAPSNIHAANIQTAKDISTSDLAISTDHAVNKKSLSSSIPLAPLSLSSNYWQLLLVGLSIVLLGLAIGASVKALTVKNNPEQQNSRLPESTASSLPDRPSAKASPSSSQNPNPDPTQNSPKTATPSTSEPTKQDGNSQPEEQTITLEKFNRIQKGMTIQQVEKILGASGRVIAENTSTSGVGQVYSWKNPQGSNAIVEFKDGQVVAKAQAGL